MQPFWEVIGYIDRRLPELLQKHGLRLCLFKQGVTPHPADPHAIDGTRLEVQVSEMLSEELQRPGKKPGPNTLGAAVAALLTFAVGGNSAHAAHLNGIEICFSPESLVAVACFSHALCSSTENALMDVREEVAEVLMIQGVSDKFMKQRAPDHADHAATLPPPAQSTGPYSTGLLHAEPLLSELQVPPLVETRSPPPRARARPWPRSQVCRPPQARQFWCPAARWPVCPHPAHLSPHRWSYSPPRSLLTTEASINPRNPTGATHAHAPALHVSRWPPRPRTLTPTLS